MSDKDCECVNWCSDGIHRKEEALAGHHYRCPKFEVAFMENAMKLIDELHDAMRVWGNEEDGIPDFAWDAWCRADLDIRIAGKVGAK